MSITNGHDGHLPNRADRRNAIFGREKPGGVVDLGSLANKANEKLRRTKVVLFPVGQMVEWLKMDGSYTIEAEGLPAGAELVAMNPVPQQPYVALIFYHPDWPERSMAAVVPGQNAIEILQVRWQRYKVKERGDEYNPASGTQEPAG